MARIGYDFAQFYEERAKLPAPDGKHCIIPGCGKPLPARRKNYCSDECYNQWYRSLGIRDWARVRDEVIQRDGGCMDCGRVYDSSVSWSFEVHHLKMISEGGDEFDPENCITLCVDCHKVRYGRRSTPNNRKLDEFV